jgi:hypothetical protein
MPESGQRHHNQMTAFGEQEHRPLTASGVIWTIERQVTPSKGARVTAQVTEDGKASEVIDGMVTLEARGLHRPSEVDQTDRNDQKSRSEAAPLNAGH